MPLVVSTSSPTESWLWSSRTIAIRRCWGRQSRRQTAPPMRITQTTRSGTNVPEGQRNSPAKCGQTVVRAAATLPPAPAGSGSRGDVEQAAPVLGDGVGEAPEHVAPVHPDLAAVGGPRQL